MKRASKRRRRCARCSRRRARPRRQRGGADAAPTFSVILSNGKQLTADDSPLLTREETAAEPTVQWSPTPTPPTRFALLCVDPDAPAPAAPYLHWLVVNCDGTAPASGEGLVPWAPPTPPAGSGIHRYRFLLAEQKGEVVAPAPAARAGFPFEAFLAEHGFRVLTTREYRVRAD